jgi:hypothetical protein
MRYYAPLGAQLLLETRLIISGLTVQLNEKLLKHSLHSDFKVIIRLEV